MQISANIQRKIKVAAATAAMLTVGASPAFAQTQGGTGGSTITITAPPNSGFFSSAGSLVTSLLQVVMVIGVILVFAYLVLGGIEYITSGGEKGKTEAARNKITSAIIGLIILASSYAILTILLHFIGFTNGGTNNLLNVGGF